MQSHEQRIRELEDPCVAKENVISKPNERLANLKKLDNVTDKVNGSKQHQESQGVAVETG